VLIWTTTPWTIPSNLAIAFNPALDYAAFEVDGGAVIVAQELAARVGASVNRSFDRPVAVMKGDVLEGIRFRHPLYERDSPGVLADYVTLEQGTGAVHTAPGHGADDFLTGVKYGLDIYAPVGPGGHFLEDVALFAGLRVFDANPHVEEALAAQGRLWKREMVSHQYPHCWRCHNPVIFLATAQWFVRMDGEPAIPCEDGELRTLRDAARHAIDSQVRWIPAWGHDRIYNMVSNRPDWCISRQRVWGVPIPAVDCASCGDAILTSALIDRAVAVFDEHGADAWYERPLQEFLPPGFACPTCGGTSFERENDILDVWFDSGSSHEAVLPRYPELAWPSDMYLEGSDQHRGWFQSSLLVALATRGRPPFREVLTHGFLIDLEGRKMSKSLGNVIAPQDVIKESGAEIVRLWVAMTEFTEELRVSREILTRVVDVYRKLRNTCRILVANLYDFDPGVDAVPLESMDPVDRYALARYAEAADRILRAYDAYDFSTVSQTVNTLMTVHISAFYVDVTKDRMYTLAPKSHERKSTQTAMYRICEGLAKLLAPILPVTADELWRHLPGTRSASVHLEEFGSVEAWRNPSLLREWDRLIAVRDEVNGALEQRRKEKLIGNSLGARVAIGATGQVATLLATYESHLPALLIVSDVVLRASDPDGADSVEIRVEKAGGVRCDRCWRFVPRVRTEPDVAGVCDRCADALAEPVGR
jgi:isoleucyl-tRNA synthetase